MGFFAENGNEYPNNIDITKTLYFDAENVNNISTDAQIDLTKKNKQVINLSGNATLTFVDPKGPSSIVIRVVQDNTGSRVITWPSSVKWGHGVVPALTPAANAIDIVAFYFDGTTYYGNVSHNFS